MNAILKPLIEIDHKEKFSIGTKLFKKIKNTANEYQEFKLTKANFDGNYMMLIRKIGKNSNIAEYGIIPEKAEFGRTVINIPSFQRTLEKKLIGWFFGVKMIKNFI